MTVQNERWRWARDFTQKAPTLVAFLLLCALFLYAGDRAVGSVTKAMEQVVMSLENVALTLAVFAETAKKDHEARHSEHEALVKSLEECKEMGHSLARCQQEQRDRR